MLAVVTEDPNTTANIISAFAAVFTAFSLVITAVAMLWKQVKVGRKVDEVHTIVNQQRTDAQNYQRALIRALTDAGIRVPHDQSVDEPASPAPSVVTD